MNGDTTKWSRRKVLLASLVGGSAAWLVGPLSRLAAAQQKASLIARPVDRVPDGPDDDMWRTADILEVPMAPQAVVKPRTYEASTKAVKVRALYDAERIAFRLEWADAARDARIGGVASFRDAVAVEFPANPADGIPYFAMGEAGKPVTIYQWKADWQFSNDRDVDEENPNMVADWYPFSGREAGEIAGSADYGSGGESDKSFHTSWASGSLLANPELHARTSVEKLLAEGFGTIGSFGLDGQDAVGTGVWKDGGWTVVISVPRAQEQFAFEPGRTIPLAFAKWDGSKGERGGEKAVSTWYFLTLEQPLGTIAYAGPVLAFGGILAAQAWALRLLRRKARHAGAKNT
jgi:hypothetical protein